MSAYVSKLVYTERINTGDFSFREYVVDVQNDVDNLTSPEGMVALARAITRPDVPKPVTVPKEGLAEKVLLRKKS